MIAQVRGLPPRIFSAFYSLRPLLAPVQSFLHFDSSCQFALVAALRTPVQFSFVPWCLRGEFFPWPAKAEQYRQLAHMSEHRAGSSFCMTPAPEFSDSIASRSDGSSDGLQRVPSIGAGVGSSQ
jgi:hypothetical protein